MANLVPRAQLADNIEPFDCGAEHGVAGIKIMLRAEAEVELRPSGIRMLGARHGERTVNMAVAGIGCKFGLDAPAGTAGASIPSGPGFPAATSSPDMSRVLGSPPWITNPGT